MKVANKPLRDGLLPCRYQVRKQWTYQILKSVLLENAPFITLDNRIHFYFKKQFHFHTPSEHTFKRQHYPLEIHFVHQSEDDKKRWRLLPSMVSEGEANPAISTSR